MPSREHDYSLSISDTNALKGIAICAMLWHHLFIGQSEYGFLPNLIAEASNICVAMFLFLSGYGLSIQFAKLKSNGLVERFTLTTKFLCKRYIKFYLNYWIIFAITVPIGLFVFHRTFEIAYGPMIDMPGFAILDFLGLMGKQSYNTTWWFNRIILFFYLFFPFLYWGSRYLVSGLAILALLYIWPHDILFYLEEMDIAFPMYFFIFALGVFCARQQDLINKILARINNYVILGLSVLGIIISIFFWQKGIIPVAQITTWDTVATLFISLLIASIQQQIKINLKPLQILGKHSMNMYLVHTFIFGYFFSNFIYWFKYPVLIFGVLLGCSLLFSICLEFCKNKSGFYKMQTRIINWITNLHLTK